MNEDASKSARDPGKVTGVVLIVLGLLLFVLQLTHGITVTLMFLVGGAIFIGGYFTRHSYGLLIPGCILAGMGLGQLGEDYVDFVHNPSFVGLGLGFLAIFVIDKIHRGVTAWWPLIPGGILFLMGIETGQFNLGTLLSKGWPLALVIIGLLYLAGRIGSRSGSDKDRGP